MTIRLKHLCGATGNDSDTGRDSEINLTYELWDTDPVEVANDNYFANLMAYLRTHTPSFLTQDPDGYTGPVQTLYRGPIRWREDDDTGRFIFDVQYKVDEVGEALKRWSFDTQGGTVKIYTSRATARYPGSAPDHSGSIDVNDENEVQGVDVTLPALKLSVRKRFLKTDTTYGPTSYMAYIKDLAKYTGQTNSDTWETYAAGELLFLGATGEFMLGKDNEIEYHFAASQNIASYSIGSITGIAKKGHDYVWVKFEHALSGSNRIRRPKWAYVERVYSEFDFDLLGI
jgi:hypothetical protein